MSNNNDDYFGRCPACGNSELVHIERNHWMVCHAHKVRWCIGANLFSSWRHVPEKKWEEDAERIGPYRELKSEEAEYLPPERCTALGEFLESTRDTPNGRTARAGGW